jgi:DNA-directed RNA polymerase specialized sigma24 family protein
MRHSRADFESYAAARIGSLLRLGYQLTGDPALARVVAEEALAVTYRRWPATGPDGADEISRRALVRACARQTAPSAEPAARPNGVLSVLAALPSRQRAAVVLAYAEGLDDHEVAHLLGTSVRRARDERVEALAVIERRLHLRDAG